MRFVRLVVWTFLWLAGLIALWWAIGALYYDFPIPTLGKAAAIGFLVLILLAIVFVGGNARKLLAVGCGFLIVLGWWRLTLKPSNNGPWQSDVAETAWADSNGDEITIHNVRNCDYRTETDYTTNWETRTVRLSHLAGVDLAIMYWGSPWMAHPIVSFRFDDALPICFSIETRKRVGQEYSAFRGLYRQYTLIYIVADERDSIRVRSNYRHGEDVYLYRTLASPDQARKRFLDYIKTLNQLRDHPRWYNAVTTNCTTSIRTQRPTNERMPWDWRLLVNGKGDELLYERHLIATGGLNFAELKQKSHINEQARAADQDPDFSQRIREGVPGFK